MLDFRFVHQLVFTVMREACLAYLTLDQSVWFQSLGGDIALFSWVRHLPVTLTGPLSTKVFE